MIKKVGSKWVLYTHDGKKVLGRHDTREEAVAQEPRVVAALAPERGARRPAHVDVLALVQHVLLQLGPVRVAPGQHLLHEGVEIGLRARRRRRHQHERGTGVYWGGALPESFIRYATPDIEGEAETPKLPVFF